MVVIKLAVLKRQRAKDGTYKIRVAIGHKSETHYIVTPYSVNAPADFKGGVVVRGSNSMAINLELAKILADYHNRLSRVSNPEHYSCKELRKLLLSMTPTSNDMTVETALQEYVEELKRDGRASYADMLERHCHIFTAFTRGDVFLSTITPDTVNDYARYLRRRGASTTSQNIYLSNLRTIINRAVKQRRVTYDVHPFLNFTMPHSQERELDITVEELRAIRDIDIRSDMRRAVRDIFMLSYYLGGMNLVDLIAYDFRRPLLDYVRHKSRNMKQGNDRTVLTIQPEARVIIDRYMDKDTGLLALPFSHEYKSQVAYVNRILKEMARSVNISDGRRVCWYTARKSFVQHGFDLGITLEVLEYCIGQSVKRNRPIFNYVKIMRRHADIAVRKIIDNLNG